MDIVVRASRHRARTAVVSGAGAAFSYSDLLRSAIGLAAVLQDEIQPRASSRVGPTQGNPSLPDPGGSRSLHCDEIESIHAWLMSIGCMRVCVHPS